ncbi:MAG: insulinase family protein [Elusimicrobia bacterium]|nr:insulinase family protein [Elusimicrobiota bacterium]
MKNIILKTAVLGAIMTLSISSSWAVPPSLPKIGGIDFKPPKGSRYTLENGMVVYLLKDNTLPVTHMTAIIKTGKIYDPKEKIGLGELTAGLLKDGGTLKYKSDEIDKTLEFLGASVESSIANEEARVDMFALKKDLDKVLDIYASVLMEPAFEDDKTALKKAEALEIIRRRNDNPNREAQREALRYFYGADHPYGWRPEISTVEPLTKKDLKAYHGNYYRPNNIIIAAAGDFGSESAFLAKLKEKFGGWTGGEVRFPEIPPVKINETRRVYFIEKDISQTFIVMLQKGVKRHDPVEFPLYVTNEMLGGGLSSRLAAEIRSRKGLAYSVYSYFAKRPDYGFINASCGTKPETYSQALSELLRQFELIKTETAPDAEVKRAKDSIINSFVFRFPTPFDLISERALYEHYAYPADYLDTYVDNMARVDPKAVLETSQKLFKPESSFVFVIGNTKKFDKPLSEFGPVTEVKED